MSADGVARFLFVAVGGAAGASLRYALALFVARHATSGFPWPTFLVNVVGSFGLGVLLFAWPDGGLTPALRLGLTTGVMGGFTTYSSFNYEALRLATEGEVGMAMLYVLLTLGVCAAAGLGGVAVGRALG